MSPVLAEKTATLQNLMKNLPYDSIVRNSSQVEKQIEEQNPKYDLFQNAGEQRPQKLKRLSVSYRNEEMLDGRTGALIINRDYANFIYSQLDMDKMRRLQEMRRMAMFAEVSDCTDEICDEAMTYDEVTKRLISFELDGEYNNEIKEAVKKEFEKFVEIFDLDNNGWEYVRQFLIEGELFFENIISKEKPWFGILGVVNVPADVINPVYYNVQNGDIREFRLRKLTPQQANATNSRNVYQSQANYLANVAQQKEEIIILSKPQVTYMHSNRWNEEKTFRVPFLEMCRRAYKMLSLVEDAIVIYRLVRAPERLVFKIDVGSMPPAQAEAHVRRMMQQYWQKKAIDPTGGITNSYDPQSMLDSYWFTKRGDSEGSSVESLPAGANLGQLEDLNYFVEKLYKSLKVPTSRLSADTPARDGTEITREELRFAKFIQRIQRQIVQGIKTSFITHLKLRGKRPADPESNSWWEQYELRANDIKMTMASPTNFAAMREQQQFEVMANNLTTMAGIEGVSISYALKRWMKMTDAEIRVNNALLRFDAAMKWQLEQIQQFGPNYRKAIEQQNAELMGGGQEQPGGGDMSGLPGGGGGGGGAALPDFGDIPDAGGDTAGAEGGDAAELPDMGDK